MGIKFSKPGPGKAENLSLVHVQHQVLNYLARSFYIRNWVSKERRRMLVGGYDLDMSYITDHLLAMSFPAERIRSIYRNPIWQVYNLCIEEAYDPLHFYGRVETFPFDDNHVPPLEIIKQFCESVDSWLSSDPSNIAVVHCMAGKGRTGLMVCAYLVYSGMSAEEALQVYAQKRTTNNEGVSIPSQRRYVGYWENVLSFPRGVDYGLPIVNLPKPCSRELLRIRLYDTVNIRAVFFVVSELQEVSLSQKTKPEITSPSSFIVDHHRPSLLTSRRRARSNVVVDLSSGRRALLLSSAISHLVVELYCVSHLESIDMTSDFLILSLPVVFTSKSEYSLNLKADYCIHFNKVPGQRYYPPVEIFRSCCRKVKKGCSRPDSPCYYLSCIDRDEGGNQFKPVEPHLVVQMDTESPVLYQKTCLDYYFEKPVKLSARDLDKVGKKGKSICGPAFCLELLFGPANANYLFSASCSSNGSFTDD
ncbi:Phosphoric monoester hydrolase [Sarracenia purpurea var. burkii]